MNFDMKLEDDFASFTDDDGIMVFVDSFDNKSFDVRIGTAEDSNPAGTISASSDSELNDGLLKLYNEFKGK